MRSFRRGHGLVVGALAAACFGLSMLGGCNILAPVIIAVTPPPSKPAEYQLADRTTVVFVDDRSNQLARRTLRILIGDAVSETLMQKKVLKDTITTRDAIAVANRETSNELMSMEEIGRAVGAEQLIFVQVVGYTDSIDGVRRRPAAVVEVSVLDVVNRARLFPAPDSDGRTRTLQVISPREFPEDAYRSPAARRELQDAMSKIIGVEIAKLFFKHDIENAQFTTEITR